jgi:Holliday junction DNA helicase RuvA
MESDTLLSCITEGDVVRLSGIPGIGRKTAERIILELKERLHKYIAVADLPEPSPGQTGSGGTYQDDLLSALMNLGYSRPQAEKGVRQAMKQFGDESFENLLKQTLKLMMTK